MGHDQVDLLGLYRKTKRAERQTAERAEFARLKARFEPDGIMPMGGLAQPAAVHAITHAVAPGSTHAWGANQLAFAL